MEVLAEMVQKAPTRVAVVEPCLAEPRDIEEFKEVYENVVQVGSGSFGSVYYIRWPFTVFFCCIPTLIVTLIPLRKRETGESAAAKYLRQEKIKVRAEAAMLRSLIQSAFVVQLVGLFESPLNSVLVTEYLAGGDLITRTAPDDYCLTERKCQIFIRQIVRGVQFIHSQRILHLDMKPFNIMFANPDDDYNLRIIDFGLAENMDKEEHRVKMTMCGTLEYMSPEVMDCKFASPASDMW
jgi:serine/threonine protein kinase